ncbi:MAG: hypothetical protein R3250_02260 [Melioribacteraceae bacterium]|nr:hypothetical protein [Melioribacteraceae bacterium]
MQKLHQIIGKAILKLIFTFCVILATVFIVDALYEVEKEELFLEAYTAFEERYKTERNEIFDQYGLLHHNKIKLQEFKRYEI